LYELYKHSKSKRLPIVLVFGGGAIGLAYGGIHDFMLNGFSFNTVMFTLFVTLFFSLSIGILSIKEEPYRWIEMKRQQNPAFVQDMENDFINATEICMHLYRGYRYYFIKGDEFHVVPIGHFTEIHVEEKYRWRLGRYYCVTLKSLETTDELHWFQLNCTEQEVWNILNTLAMESRIGIAWPGKLR